MKFSYILFVKILGLFKFYFKPIKKPAKSVRGCHIFFSFDFTTIKPVIKACTGTVVDLAYDKFFAFHVSLV